MKATYGVFIESALVSPKEGKIPIIILNTRNVEVKLKKFQPQLVNANEFEIQKFELRHFSVSGERIFANLEFKRPK
jgi:hypothetical protein